MVRVFKYAGFGLCVDMAAMSWRQAEDHVKSGSELLRRGEDVKADEWFQRVVGAVETSLKAGSDDPANTLDHLKDNFDLPTLKKAIPAMYDQLMQESGLKSVDAGEEKAAPISASSAAA